MNELLFRGKALDSGEWVYGYYFRCKDFRERERHAIRPEDLRAGEYYYASVTGGIEVDPETVGRFVGLTDKNGKRIFEGDLVRFVNLKTGELSEEIQEVVWDDEQAGFMLLLRETGYKESFDGVPHWYVVIGNIHDNPELLKGE